MTSKEAFEKIIELCNHYQHTIEKDTEIGTIWGYPIDNIRKDLEILEKYKSIEDILGIDLITLFKALKDRQVIFKHIYGLKNPKIYLETHKIAGLLFDGNNYGLWLYDNGYGDEFCAYTKDYGKTWALTKEELEDDK